MTHVAPERQGSHYSTSAHFLQSWKFNPQLSLLRGRGEVSKHFGTSWPGEFWDLRKASNHRAQSRVQLSSEVRNSKSHLLHPQPWRHGTSAFCLDQQPSRPPPTLLPGLLPCPWSLRGHLLQKMFFHGSKPS